jgi:transposase
VNFKEYDQNQQFLLPPVLQDFIPAEHLARIINEVVEGLDLSELYNSYSDMGCTAYHPRMMLKLLFYGYATGERSSRLLASRTGSDVAYMYLAGMQRPDFRTINRFRKDNIGVLKGLFVQIVRLCGAMGMISIGKIAIDGTKFKANASYSKTIKGKELADEISDIEREIAGILRESEEADAQEDHEQGEDGSIYEVPKELGDKQKLKEKLEAAKKKLAASGHKDINLTDNECRTMIHRGFRPVPSYNGQAAVEEKSGVIVAAAVSDNPADYWGLKAMVEQIKENIGRNPDRVLADSGYDSYDNLAYLEDKGITGYIANQTKQGIESGKLANAEFDRSRFVYDAVKDAYRCPMGETLRYWKKHAYPGIGGGKLYICDNCQDCSSRTKCTRSKYRILCINPREHLVLEMRDRLESVAGREIYSRRKSMIEPIFGDMKHNRNMRELKLRGRTKAAGEFLIMCITHNIRKIAKRVKELRGGLGYQQAALAGGFNRGILGCQTA